MAHHDPGRQVSAIRPTPARLASGLAALASVALALALSRSAGSALVFLGALGVFLTPGIPLSRRFFPAGQRLVAAPALGYLVSSLLASGLYSLGRFNLPWLVGAVLALAAALWFSCPQRGDEKDTSPQGSAAPVVAAALALVALPFLRIGEETPEGFAYRAYFSADLMTHLSVVAELQKRAVPPMDPFYSGAPLGYYWLFFLFPAIAGEAIENERALVLTYLAGDLLFVGLLFVAARRFAMSRTAVLVAVGSGLAASGYEGAVALLRAPLVGLPLSSFREMNVDALSRWVFELTSIDGLHRSLLYTPQHLFSYGLLLLLVLLIFQERPWRSSEAVLAGLLLGGMIATSAVTALVAAPWCATATLFRGAGVKIRLAHLVPAGAATALLLGWCAKLGFFSGAGAALTLRAPSTLEVPALLLLEAGGLMLLSVKGFSKPQARPVSLLAAMALLVVLFLDLADYRGVWVAWRAGSVFLLALTLAAAAGVDRWRPRAVALILVPALFTCALDVYNAQDVGNRQESAGGFPWTTVVAREEMEALGWIRAHTDPKAVVQLDARVRGAGAWALVPALGERRMAYGYPIFLLNPTRYLARGRRIRPLFRSPDAEEAHRLAAAAGIDYVFVGRAEIVAPGNHVDKFRAAPELFRPVFENAGVTVYQVLPRASAGR